MIKAPIISKEEILTLILEGKIKNSIDWTNLCSLYTLSCDTIEFFKNDLLQ